MGPVAFRLPLIWHENAFDDNIMVETIILKYGQIRGHRGLAGHVLAGFFVCIFEKF